MQLPDFQRLRRLRRTAGIRSMVRETELNATDFIYPLFAAHGSNVKEEIGSMPGVYHLSIDQIRKEVEEVTRLGIGAVLLFGVPANKDHLSSEAYAQEGIVQQAVRAIKEENPELTVITDVCLCAYNPLGHCGIVHEGEILNDPTLELLAKTAVSHAQAGADIVAPSDMMDGRIAAIRAGLDREGFLNIPIMSYSVKYASSYYGPFRDAAHSAPAFGDRKTYQMDPANAREAMREAAADVEEGADFLMVKPAMAYMDIIRMLRDNFDLPIVSYNVSGEYSMIKAAARNGWVDEQKVVLELLTGLKRAGSDLIITYHAKEAAEWLK
ncbi:porphobilinogen synthase [Effusibacillus lacus]|uniref:Delta-aminolevulinic acid dehydratase n=1 Tax=Effusibacillus lacus TaxID=1348429 RepID=A0A292YNL7_9BACL|nr:porphobilinogen synthase [Effusibacillus lacus]TCS76476.1 porphobilinogen synthase [Effusibacillus lacus]GAX90501.1 delta-aminolevulinic acid dehydratase [Effusibacillus lacus]